jgi:carbon starvation protein
LAKDFPHQSKNRLLAQANKFSDAIARGEVLKPAKSLAEMQTIVLSNQINAALCAFFMVVLVVMIFASIGAVRRALASNKPTVNEAPAEYADVVSETVATARVSGESS